MESKSESDFQGDVGKNLMELESESDFRVKPGIGIEIRNLSTASHTPKVW